MPKSWSGFPRIPQNFRKWAKGSGRVRLLVIVFGLFLMSPDRALQHPRVRFISKGLKISTSKTNPPRLAFEEALQNRRIPVVAPAPVRDPVISLNEVIERGQMRSAVLALYYRQIDLRPMIFARQEIIQAIQQSQGQRRSGRVPLKMAQVSPATDIPERRFEPNAGQLRSPTTFEANYSANAAGEQEWFDQLSPRQRRLLEASGLRTSDLAGPMAPSLAESLAAKVDEELQRLQGTVITPSGATPARNVNDTGAVGTTIKTEDDKDKASKKSFQVAGHLFLDALTAFLPDHRIEVVWLREGQNRRSGRFSMTDSHFTIDVDELVGAVRLEMYDKSGSVVAAGGVRLSPDLTSQALTKLQVRLRPVGQVASNFTDFYKQPTDLFSLTKKKVWSFGKNPIRTKASFDNESVFEADPQGMLFIDGIAGGSSSFAMTESQEYYPSLHLITSGQKEALPLIPKKTARAMLEIIEQQLGYTDAQKNGAIVMGQVTAEGRPLSGVQVEVEGHPEAQIIYLNDFLIPDPQLKTSSGTGYFVLVHLPQGFYSLRAMRGNQFVGYGNVVNEPEAASFVEIEEAVRFAPFEIRTYDAFDGNGQPADLSFQSLNQKLIIDGYGQVEHPVVARYSLVELDSKGDAYVPAIYPYAGDTEYLHLPMIPRAWMDDIIGKAKVNLTPSAGALIGFSERGGYEISLPHLPGDAPVAVIYFDVQGHQVPAAVDNGGFLLLNLPEGAQTVVLQHALGGVVSRVLNADADRLTVAKFVF